MAKRAVWTPTEKDVFQISILCRNGFTYEQIAEMVGVSRRTFFRAAKQEPLRGTLLKGKIDSDNQVTQTLFKMATSGECPSATIFWMKTRRGWKDSGQENPPPDPNSKPEIKVIWQSIPSEKKPEDWYDRD